MTISKDLFLSILSLDAYNRGNQAGMSGIGGVGSAIGNAIIIQQSDVLPGTPGASAGFYGVAYNTSGVSGFSSGEKTIAYRGTDQFIAWPGSLTGSDVWNGWGVGAGSPYGQQAALAVEFYKAVAGVGVDLQAANISLTGHSLGGGLAGFVGGLYGKYGALFDNMAFEMAAQAANAISLSSSSAFNQTLKELIYGSADPWNVSLSNLRTLYVQGEALAGFRSLQATSQTQLDLSATTVELSSVQRHDMALAVLLKYASEAGIGSQWLNASPYFLPSLFDDSIASFVGAATYQGTSSLSQVMRDAIAYSVIDEGMRIFGDTGIRALFDDANDIGAVLEVADASKTLKAAAAAIAKIIVQFAGHLAIDKVLASSTSVPIADGILTLASDQKTLAIDFSDTVWSAGTSGSTAPTNIVGRSEIIDTVFSTYFGGAAGQPFSSDIRGGMKWLWNDDSDNIFDRFVFATRDGALTTTLADRGYSSSKVTLFATGGSSDTVTGSQDDEFIFGSDGADTIRGGIGKDLIAGGNGDDRLSGGEGKDFIAGGSGNDSIFYEVAQNTGLQLNIRGIADAASNDIPTLELSTSTSDVDRVLGVEKIELTNAKDTVRVGGGLEKLSDKIRIDAGGQASGERDVLDFSGLTSGVSIKQNNDGIYASSGLFSDLVSKPSVAYSNFEEVILTAGNDTVDVSTPSLIMHLGAGNDIVKNAGPGSIIFTEDGSDDIRFSRDIGIADLSGDDRITIGGILEFHGGLRYKTSESPWATSYGGLFKTGINDAGELVVKVDGLGTIYVLNWGASGGMSAPFEQRPGQISVFEYEMGVYRLLDPNRPSHMTQMGTWELLGAIVKVTFGVQFWKGVDPIVLDLDGDGLEMTPLSTISPIFDADGDGYAERTAWVGPDDGFLVRDLNGNGRIDDVTEMFGGAVSGFSVLAPLDGNSDGKVDASDNGLVDFNGDGTIDVADTFDALKLWRDLDEDGVTDAGELFSLANLGVASISVASIPRDNLFVNGNQIAETGTYTRADGTIGTLGEVLLNIDNVSTQYTGGPITITAQAAALPEHKGFGTLVSLREAMSLAPSLATVVSNTVSQLSSLSLDDLRAVVLPILTGWALASPLEDGDRDPGTSAPKLLSHRDVSVLVAPGQFGKEEVIDFAYETTATIIDDQGHTQTIHFWGLASGETVRDSNGEVIDHPTLSQLLASPQTRGAWTSFGGDLIAFTERYLGETLPIDRIMAEGEHAGSDSIALFNNILSTIDLIVARIVVQDGPLSAFFSGITYDAQSDNFVAVSGNDRDLIPVYEAIFGEAVQEGYSAAWISQWKPLLDVIIGDYSRGESYLLNTYGFIAENLVAAYENTGFAEPFAAVASALGIPSAMIVTGAGILTGSSDADILYASTSNNDILRGGVGPDTYVFGREIGHDIVDDEELANQPQTLDTLRLAQFRPEEISARREDIDLILTINATGETITIVGQFIGRQPGLFGGNLLPDRGVGEIIFADGTVWDALEIAKAVRHPASTSDTLQGTRAIDYLDGGAGDDVLLGGNEGDHYFFDAGYGHDRIQDDQTDILIDTPDFVVFGPGFTQDNLVLTRIGDSNDLHITFAGNPGDGLTVTDQFYAAYSGLFDVLWYERIEIFAFADGGYFNWESVIQYLDATAGTDGDDVIYGFAYEDVLDGGKGNDYLSGGNENDTYIFGRGYGSDTIEDRLTMILSGNDDTVLFNPDVLPSDLDFHRSGDSSDLQITIDGANDVLTVKGQFQVNYGLINTMDNRIEFFKFADGTIIDWEDIILYFNATAGTDGDDTIYGFSYADTLSGGKGDDTLAGGREDDTYIYARGDGNDVIIEGPEAQTGAFDTLVLQEIDPSDVSIVRNGNHLTLIIAESAAGAGDGGSILLRDELDDFFSRGVEQITFSDGTVWTQNDLRLMLLVQSSTSGDDTIAGFNVDDIIRGGAGDDTISGGEGDDTYLYARGDGNDTIIEGGGGNRSTIDTLVLESLNPADVSLVRSGNDLTLVLAESAAGAGDGGSLLLKEELNDFFSRGVEKIAFSDGTIWTQNDLRLMLLAQSSTSGDDTIVGFNVDDIIRGGAGNDSLSGGEGDDTYLYARGDGNDTIIEGGGGNRSTIDTLVLEDIISEDVTLVRSDNDLTLVISESAPGAGDGGAILLKDGIEDWFSRGVEYIEFSNGVSWTQADLRAQILASAATTGDDVIAGFNGDDTFQGGLGDDILSGRSGNDTYIYARGDGRDTIDDQGSSGTNQLILHGIAASEITIIRNGDNAILLIGAVGADGRLTIKGQFTPAGRISIVTFDDGTIWSDTTMETIAIANDGSIVTHYGTVAGETIIGTSDVDIIDGDGGADSLQGVGGSDTYIWGVGSGNDTIIEDSSDIGTDAVRLSLTSAAVELSRSQNDLFVTIIATGETLRIVDQFRGSNGIEQIVFSDGAIWARSQIVDAAWLRGTVGNDTVYGSSDADTFYAKDGNDTLYGSAGDDTYVYGAGFGNDIVTEYNSDAGSDTVRFVGLNRSDTEFGRQSDDLLITVTATGEVLKISNQLNGSDGVEQIVFADGTVWDRSQMLNAISLRGTSGNDTIYGSSDADTFYAEGGDDTLYGSAGDDTYYYGVGFGSDTVTEYGSDAGSDRIKLVGLNSSDVEFSRESNDLLITITATGEALKISNQLNGSEGVEQVIFSDGTIWDRTQMVNAIWLRGTSGNDTIYGSSSVDTFYAKIGDDTLYGSAGDDIYYYGIGFGNDIVTEYSSDEGVDIIKLVGLLPSDVEFSRQSNDLFVLIVSSGEMLKVSNQFNGTNGVEQIVFSDGAIWNRSQILDAAWLRGSAGNDTIYGSSDVDIYYASVGNDTLYGGGSGDIYYFGVGFGNDRVSEYNSDSGTDIVKLIDIVSTDVRFSRQSDDLVITIVATGETLAVSGQFNGTNGIEQILFADGTTWDRAQIKAAAWILGTNGSEAIYGSADADTLDGLAGNDTLRGGDGGDTYVYGAGSGNDTISESGSDSGIDIVKLVGLDIADVTFNRSGSDLVIQIILTGEKLTIEGQFNGTNGIEELIFSDNTNWDRATIADQAWINGTSGSDTLYGTSGNDNFYGSLGDDRFNSGEGSDTYIYALGDGNDYIDDESGSTTDIDTLRFTNLNANDLTFSRVGVHLVVTVNSNGQTITLDEQFYSESANWGLEKVVFGDGSNWDRATLNSNAWYRGTNGNDTISGSSWDDTFKGDLGDDRFNSGEGSDTYVYSLGDGNDYIDDESGSTTDVDTLRFTDLNANDLTFSRVGVHLVVTVNSNGQTITLDEQFYSQIDYWGIEKIEFGNGSTWDRVTLNSNAWYRGANGNDTISGSSWDDTIYGDSGNDILSGGGGDDTFVFRAGFGQDTITDFSVGHDKLQFQDEVFADVTAAFAAASASGNDTIITIDASTQVLLKNVAFANLHVDDFRVV